MMDVLITGLELSAIVYTNNSYNLHVCQLLYLFNNMFVMLYMFEVLFCFCFFLTARKTVFKLIPLSKTLNLLASF